MNEPAFKLVETSEVETKAISIVDQANAVKVIDPETYTAAGILWKQIKDMMQEVSDTFNPIIDAAHKSHKKALEQKAKYYVPLEQAYKSVKKLMSDYDLEQERIRQAEQRRLEEIARKEEEERRLMEAIAAEEELKARGATKEEAATEAFAIMEEPVSVAPVIIPKATPKLAGGPVYRTIWKARIIDERKIPRQYLIPDMVKINGVVRSLKNQHGIDGIEAYEERV